MKESFFRRVFSGGLLLCRYKRSKWDTDLDFEAGAIEEWTLYLMVMNSWKTSSGRMVSLLNLFFLIKASVESAETPTCTADHHELDRAHCLFCITAELHNPSKYDAKVRKSTTTKACSTGCEKLIHSKANRQAQVQLKPRNYLVHEWQGIFKKLIRQLMLLLRREVRRSKIVELF